MRCTLLLFAGCMAASSTAFADPSAGTAINGPVSVNMNGASAPVSPSTPASVFETTVDGPWAGMVLRNNSPGNAAQTQIFLERYDNSSPSPLLMIWQMAFDINDNQGWKGLYNIEAIDPLVGVIATPLSLARTGQVGIGQSPQAGTELAINGSLRTSNVAGAASSGQIQFGSGSNFIVGDSSNHAIGFYPQSLPVLYITPNAIFPGSTLAFPLGTPAYRFSGLYSASADILGTATALNFVGVAAGPTLSSCGTNPSTNGTSTNNGGNFFTGGGSPTSCTLAFQTPFPISAFCAVTPSTTFAGSYSMSAQNRFGFTLSLSTGATTTGFNYVCAGS